MTSDVFESMREGLASVRMDLPVEAIEARKRTLRRNRSLAGMVGVGLPVALGLALVLPMTNPEAPRDQTAVQPAASSMQGGERMEFAAFSLSSTANGTVTITFKQVSPDPEALEKALEDAGIPAIVRVNEICHGAPLPASRLQGLTTAIFGAERFPIEFGSDGTATLTINRSAVPETVTVSIGLALNETRFVQAAGVGLSEAGSPATCDPMKVPQSKLKR